MTHKYIPNTKEQVKQMLTDMFHESVCDLFQEIPDDVKLKRDYNFEKALSELEVTKRLSELAQENKTGKVCFLGAGSYDHYIPSIVNHLQSRSEFYTAYTPYQPEVAQGTLQYIFEYQTMMTELTGMDVSNASMYDGATATAEAISMAIGKNRRKKVLVSETMHPNTIEVIKTYAHYRDIEVELVKSKNGLLDQADLEAKLTSDVSCFVASNPNFYGNIEDFEQSSKLIKANKSLFIVNVNPLTLAVLKTPKEYGADICVGEAQVFGIPLNFGGPYLGFLTTTTDLMRKMPGRICGQTTDVDGKRAFVLTLQAREQHIRRDKANSNICSNQSLNVLRSTIYLATMGKLGLKEVCEQNIAKAHYAYEQICALDNFEKAFNAPFFNEFVVKTKLSYEKIEKALSEANMLAGLNLALVNQTLENHLLFCVTEKRTKQEIDKLVTVLGGIK